MSRDDQRRRTDEARALLIRPTWSAEDIDYAVALHDLLETPGDGSDPAAAALRKRLAPALNQRFSSSGRQVDQLRAGIFSAGWLDAPDALERHLCVLLYLGLTSFLGFQTGALGQLDQAIQVLLELDREVRKIGIRARTILGSRYNSALLALGAACVIRYDSRRELLLLGQTPDAERADIKADLDCAVDASRQIARQQDPSSLAAGIGLLGFCFARRYEDDERHGQQRTIDSAIALLGEAAAMPGDDSGPGAPELRIGISDHLSAALLVRGHPRDIDEAIEILTRVRAQAAFEPMYTDAGGAATLATARLSRWMDSRSGKDEKKARSAYAGAFATAIVGYPLTAEQIASQWGGWAWSEGWWAEAGEAYSQALRALHLAVRRQASRSQRDLIVRKAPGVAAMAAFGLARAGADEAALVALETGRAILLSENFDRQTLDRSRIARLAGLEQAGRYQHRRDDAAGGGAPGRPDGRVPAVRPGSAGAPIEGSPWPTGRPARGSHRRSAGVPSCPLVLDHATVPGQQSAGRHDSMEAQVGGQQPRQRGDHGSVGPVRPWSGDVTAQYRDLMPQHQDLRILRRVAPCEERQPAEQPDHEQIDKANQHGRRG